MGSELKPNKFHYDLSMSKRTRRSLNLDHDQSSFQEWRGAEDIECGLEFTKGEEKKVSNNLSDQALENEQKKSLQQLIGGRSLNQHFSKEEQHLELVVKQQEGLNGMKLKKMVSRFAKALGHLVKVKRNQQMGLYKKPVLPLTN